MSLANVSINRTHYEVLGANEGASYEEIRSRYRSSILHLHPDKFQNPLKSSDTNHKEAGGLFLEVQRAWEVLGDTKCRAIYDAELRGLREVPTGAEDIKLVDMAVEDGGDILKLFYQCRCGDYFLIDSLELEEMGFVLLRRENKIRVVVPNGNVAYAVLPCGSCSLRIRLLIDRESEFQTS